MSDNIGELIHSSEYFIQMYPGKQLLASKVAKLENYFLYLNAKGFECQIKVIALLQVLKEWHTLGNESPFCKDIWLNKLWDPLNPRNFFR